MNLRGVEEEEEEKEDEDEERKEKKRRSDKKHEKENRGRQFSYLSEQNDANNDSSKSRANARAPKTG